MGVRTAGGDFATAASLWVGCWYLFARKLRIDLKEPVEFMVLIDEFPAELFDTRAIVEPETRCPRSPPHNSEDCQVAPVDH